MSLYTFGLQVITFIDLAGHEKYLKTTVFGMTGHAPDFCMLMVGANAGVVGMAKEHLGLALLGTGTLRHYGFYSNKTHEQ